MQEGTKVFEAGSFAEMVQQHMSRMLNVIQMTARYGERLPEVLVLLDKVDKHHAAGNARSVAMYISLFVKEYPGTKVPAEAKAKALGMGIIANREHGVGYPHADGTYHWFSV